MPIQVSTAHNNAASGPDNGNKDERPGLVLIHVEKGFMGEADPLSSRKIRGAYKTSIKAHREKLSEVATSTPFFYMQGTAGADEAQSVIVEDGIALTFKDEAAAKAFAEAYKIGLRTFGVNPDAEGIVIIAGSADSAAYGLIDNRGEGPQGACAAARGHTGYVVEGASEGGMSPQL